MIGLVQICGNMILFLSFPQRQAVFIRNTGCFFRRTNPVEDNLTISTVKMITSLILEVLFNQYNFIFSFNKGCFCLISGLIHFYKSENGGRCNNRSINKNVVLVFR